MVWRQGVVMLGAYLIQRGNTLICSARLGLDETASYGLTINLLSLITQLATIPLGQKFPEISKLRVSGNYAGIWKIFWKRLYLGVAVAVVGILAMAFEGANILHLLGSHTPLLKPWLTVLIGFIWLLETHHSQYAGLVLSENENPFILPALISGVAIFSLSWWAAGIYGVIGIIVAQGVVQLAWNNWWVVLRGLRGLKIAKVH
jgi:O-antigen/teichoic acid export membrane protein